MNWADRAIFAALVQRPPIDDGLAALVVGDGEATIVRPVSSIRRGFASITYA